MFKWITWIPDTLALIFALLSFQWINKYGATPAVFNICQGIFVSSISKNWAQDS